MPDTSKKDPTDLSRLTVSYNYGIYINPGMGRLMSEYLKRASKIYKAIHVLFCYWWPGIDREPWVDHINSLGIPNLKAHEFTIMASPDFGRKLGWKGASWPNALRTTFSEIGRITDFYRQVEMDVVHILLTEYQSSYVFSEAARRAGVPARLLGFTGVAPTPARFRKFVNRLTDRNINGILTASEADTHGARTYFPSSKQAIVRGWGLAPELFRLENVNPARFREELGIREHDLLIGTTTRLAPEKGQDTLIRALQSVFPRFPTLKCVILGGRYDSDQSERGRLEALAAELGVIERIKFLGERDDTADIFAAYDACVHLPNHDYLPFGVLECMALGKPSVCTDVGGIPSIIRDNETGFLVPAGDYTSASQALIKLLDNIELRKKLGTSAKNLVLKRYDLDALIRRLSGTYVDAITGNLKSVYED